MRLWPRQFRLENSKMTLQMSITKINYKARDGNRASKYEWCVDLKIDIIILIVWNYYIMFRNPVKYWLMVVDIRYFLLFANGSCRQWFSFSLSNHKALLNFSSQWESLILIEISSFFGCKRSINFLSIDVNIYF